MKIENDKIFAVQSKTYISYLLGFDVMVKTLGYKTNGSMYQRAVQEFLSQIEKNGIKEIKKLNTNQLNEYFNYLMQRPKFRSSGTLSSSSLKNHLFAIGLFFEYLFDTKVVDGLVIMPRIKTTTENPRQIVSFEEITELYKACETKRDRAILSLAYGCGLRRAEIEKLKIVDVQLNQRYIIIQNGKNTKRREIPLSLSVASDLRDYLVNERANYLKDTEKPLESFLVSNQGKTMKGELINERLKVLIERTGNISIINKNITLHCLRHSIAVHMIEKGAKMDFVRNFLGHVELDTTQIYARHRKINEKMLKQLAR